MLHRHILHNDTIQEATAPVLSPSQVGLLSGWGVFTTLRIADGVLFAFERHWARIARDAAAFHVPIPADPEKVRGKLLELVEANGAQDSTMRLVIVRNSGGMWANPSPERPSDLIALTADSKDWGHDVKLAYQTNGRHADSPFAGTKILSWSMNLTWLENAQSCGFDEVILLNERGEVAECTAANVFAVAGGRVLTPPLTSGCLEGVTRGVLLELAPQLGIPMEERTLKPEDLRRADELFISSTNRNLIGVGTLEEHTYAGAPGPITRRLEEAFAGYVADYIAKAAAAPVRR